LEEIAKEAADHEDKKTLKILKSMKHTEAYNIMYARMRRCLKPEEKGKITQIEVPEWDKFEFMMILGLGTTLRKVTPQLQWLFILYFYIIGQTFTDWKNYTIDLVSYKRIVLKDELDNELCLHHIKHFRGNPFYCRTIKIHIW
jgi:hypothetical protein